MGIKNLYNIIKSKRLEDNINYGDLYGKTIAIDTSIYIYNSILNVRNSIGEDYLDKHNKLVSHVLSIFNKVVLLMKNNIKPIFVFDGKTPDIKKKTVMMRRNIREKLEKDKSLSEYEKNKIIRVGKREINMCKKLLDYLGISYVQAPEEADSQCAYLCRSGLVDGVLTNDMDLLTFGTPIIYNNIFSSKDTIKISLNKILEEFKLSYDQFIDLSILLGSDYGKKIDIDPNKLLDIYLDSKDLYECVDILNFSGYETDTIENYNKIKEYFYNPLILRLTEDNIKPKKMRYKKLEKFLIDYCKFDKDKLQEKLDYLYFIDKVTNIFPNI